MKKISLFKIEVKFDELIQGKLSREEIALWALELQNAQDINRLEYIPENDESNIWTCIQFLVGVDLKDSPSEYLHNLADIKNFKNKVLSI